MGDYPFMILSLLCAVLNILPFCWQLQHGNSGPACLGFWVILTNLVTFINAMVWRNDAINRAPIWCDITSKILLAGPLGLLASNVCIARFLARVVNPRARVITARDRRNRAIFDYCFSFGVPVFVMATHIIYQPVRYAIQKTLGCMFTLTVNWPSIFLHLIWSPILALVSAIYAVYVVVQLCQHRQSFSKMVARTESALTTSRFLRLVLLSAAYAFFELPLTIFLAVTNVTFNGVARYNWHEVHEGMGRGIIFYEPLRQKADFSHYAFVIAGLLVFVFFGLSQEMLAVCKNLARNITGWKCLSRPGRRGAPTVTLASEQGCDTLRDAV
ncbi:fungal pheromone STE3G-protein-coupled receptor [Cystobasidium minutum MCA 4210]|uniref:fungal pheromone STE3G-protein-coupled receptor n=1 Tax=Cystobasidium minutum MCA 4210 TaxID=1397322 RepID=UPI0034CD98BA|eukprot:jgi/Rhomi1/180501/fgenesh1_pg.5_\